jgi:hypothetical protein
MPRHATQRRRNLIGLERLVVVQVEVDRYLIGEDAPIVTMPQPNEKPDQLAARIAAAIERSVESWGAPPARFSWIPRVRFVVKPAGNALYERIRRPLERLGIASSVEFAEEPAPPQPHARRVP